MRIDALIKGVAISWKSKRKRENKITVLNCPAYRLRSLSVIIVHSFCFVLFCFVPNVGNEWALNTKFSNCYNCKFIRFYLFIMCVCARRGIYYGLCAITSISRFLSVTALFNRSICVCVCLCLMCLFHQCLFTVSL